MYFGGLKGVGRRALRSRAEWLLRGLDLWDRHKTEVREFSRGMQQKVAIACALIVSGLATAVLLLGIGNVVLMVTA